MTNLDVERQLDANAHPSEAMFRQLAAEIPEFAGLWYDDASKTFQVMAVDARAVTSSSESIRATLVSAYPEAPSATFQVRAVKYGFTQLADWRRQAAAVFADKRVTGLDLDERANMIAVIVSDEGARDDVNRILQSAGLPCGTTTARKSRMGFRFRTVSLVASRSVRWERT